MCFGKKCKELSCKCFYFIGESLCSLSTAFRFLCVGWNQQRQQDSLSLKSIFTPFKVTQRGPTSDPNQELMNKIYEAVYWLTIL